MHLACASKPSPSSTQRKQSKLVTHRLPSKPQRRSAEMCRAEDSYIREKFRPGPTRDLEKEKRRLQNILEMGKDAPTVPVPQSPNSDVPEEMDPFQKILDEIEERRQFLEDMASLGQEQQYVNIINTEISQRIRELELMNKSSSLTTEGVTSERKEDGAVDIHKSWIRDN